MEGARLSTHPPPTATGRVPKTTGVIRGSTGQHAVVFENRIRTDVVSPEAGAERKRKRPIGLWRRSGDAGRFGGGHDR
jgi:hypothetical protein